MSRNPSVTESGSHLLPSKDKTDTRPTAGAWWPRDSRPVSLQMLSQPWPGLSVHQAGHFEMVVVIMGCCLAATGRPD